MQALVGIAAMGTTLYIMDLVTWKSLNRPCQMGTGPEPTGRRSRCHTPLD
jgi:hypothetical protein